MKVLPAILSLLFSFQALALPEAQCTVQSTGPNDVRVTVGSRQIEIIGWIHLDQQDVDVLREGFNNAIQSLDKNECFMSKNALAAALSKQNQDLKSAQTVFRKLEAVQAQKPLSYIGVEATPAELSVNFTAMRSIGEGLEALQRRCGSMIAPEVSSFGILLPGPEYAFNRAYQGNVVIRALEDEEAKQMNARQVASKSSRAVVMGGVQLRNKAIVKNALAQEGRGAIVVGLFHVPDLVREMIRQCRAL